MFLPAAVRGADLSRTPGNRVGVGDLLLPPTQPARLKLWSKGPVTLPPRNEKRETRNEKRETRNEKRETRNEKRETRNEKRETRNEKRENYRPIKINSLPILFLGTRQLDDFQNRTAFRFFSTDKNINQSE